MKEIFLNLELEKRERILQVAYEEFSESSYNATSTNRIVKKAGIGKGMLFYYFGSKEELYHYLIEYGQDVIRERYVEKIEYPTRDFIERCKLKVKVKIRAYIEIPYIFKFFVKLYLDDMIVDLPTELKKKITHNIQLSNQKLYDNLDYSLFKGDIPPAQATKMIQWIIDGYDKEVSAQLKETELSYEEMLTSVDEFEKMLAMLKIVFYK